MTTARQQFAAASAFDMAAFAGGLDYANHVLDSVEVYNATLKQFIRKYLYEMY